MGVPVWQQRRSGETLLWRGEGRGGRVKIMKGRRWSLELAMLTALGAPGNGEKLLHCRDWLQRTSVGCYGRETVMRC